nr:amidase family protein [Actinomycetota bacterium]
MSAIEAVRAALVRLDEVVALGAVVARDDRAALAAAARLDAAPGSGRFCGVALTVKDWIDVADMPCEGESPERTGRTPTK